MKKIFLGLALVLILIGTNSLTWAKNSAYIGTGDYYLVGIDAFKKGSYDKAVANLEHAIRINPKNVNARYYLAQTYLLQNRINDATAQYNRIIFLAPASDAGVLSQKGLSLIVQSLVATGTISSIDELGPYKDNYLDYVLANSGEIRKWASFPLTVYIEPKKQKDLVRKAFEQWQTKGKNLVSFNFVNSPEKAKITVNFKDKLESTSTKENFIAGYSKPYYEGIHISKSEINILVTNPESQKDFDDNVIFSTALHEIGHTLGFIGHSPDKNDIMASSTSTPKMELTTRDINTLNVFYRIDTKTLLARKSGQTDVKLQQALDYIKQIPGKSVGWANLGDIYCAKKMYSAAIKSYKKAIDIEPDKANLYSLIAASYRLSGDKQNAYLNFKKACDLDKSSTFFLSQFVA